MELKNLLTGLIESDEKVITCKSVKTREKIGYNMPDLEIWETVFHSGGQKILSGMITDYLEQLASEKADQQLCTPDVPHGCRTVGLPVSEKKSCGDA